ncbi:MAG: 50S ribosomal protein L18 [Planctomycetes bacterium]|nr:50S ribosomal protein L18 [Planctomycetota bacterium]
MSPVPSKIQRRARRKRGIRKRILGSPSRPRLSVFRSLRHIYAQIIDDLSGRTLLAVSSVSPRIVGKSKAGGGNCEAAATVGRLLAEDAAKAGVRRVVFDRAGYAFHGRIRALADAARKGGLEF